VKPAGRRDAASYTVQQYRVSDPQARRLIDLTRSVKRIDYLDREGNAELRQRLRKLAAKRMRFGYRRLVALLAREVARANHKKVYWLYTGKSTWRCGSSAGDDCDGRAMPSRQRGVAIAAVDGFHQ
jgi:hypothetical protein